MFSLPGLTDLARQNQRLITVTQYLVGASSLLVPSRSKHYEVYTEASYSLSQLISFCNSIVLDNGQIDLSTAVNLDRAGGGSGDNRESTNSLNAIGTCSKVRSLDYYLWIMTRVVTHVEVLLEKAAGAFWGENSKERSLLILAIESLKAMNRLFVLFSAPNGKQTILLNWSKAYCSPQESLDLTHYRLWYKVQLDRHNAEASIIHKSQFEKLQNAQKFDDNRRKELNSGNISTSLSATTDCAFRTTFVGRRSGMVLNYSSVENEAEKENKEEVKSASPAAAPLDASTPRETDLRRTCALSSSSFSSSDHAPPSPASTSSPSSSSPPPLSPPCLPSSSSIPNTSFPSSSSSGVTDSDSTESTDSTSDSSETRSDRIANMEMPSDDSGSCTEREGEGEDMCSPDYKYPSSTIPLNNTVYNNYCISYDISPESAEYYTSSREGDTAYNRNSLNSYDNDSKANTVNKYRISGNFDEDIIPPKSVTSTEIGVVDMEACVGGHSARTLDLDSDGHRASVCGAEERKDDEEQLLRETQIQTSNLCYSVGVASGGDMEQAVLHVGGAIESSPSPRPGPGKGCSTDPACSLPSPPSSSSSSSSSALSKEAPPPTPPPKYPFTMEQALLVSEVLYILRPVVFAWTVHYMRERRRHRDRDRHRGRGSNRDGVRHESDTTNSPYATVHSDQRSERAHNEQEAENSMFPLLEDFLPLLFSLLLEVSSIRLTAIALEMAREGNAEGNAHETPSIGLPATQKNPGNALIGNNAIARPVKNKKFTAHKWDLELSRRKLLLLYYLVRGQTFNRATLPLLQTASEFLKYVPIVNSLPAYAVSMLSYLNRSHFRSSSSS